MIPRQVLVDIVTNAIGRSPTVTFGRADGPDPIEQLAGWAVDALSIVGALADDIEEPCPAVLERRTDRLVCDGVAGHRCAMHWRVDRRTGALSTWRTNEELAALHEIADSGWPQ